MKDYRRNVQTNENDKVKNKSTEKKERRQKSPLLNYE
jgi:hypothetical protein